MKKIIELSQDDIAEAILAFLMESGTITENDYINIKLNYIVGDHMFKAKVEVTERNYEK